MIRPAIIANTQEEFNERFSNVAYADVIHLDLMDGEFVPNTSLLFDVALPKKTFHWHLMAKNPYSFIETLPGTVFYVHVETVNVHEHKVYCKKHNLPVCLAVNPGTALPDLEGVDKLLIMTVVPGQYGAPFVESATAKIKAIPKHIEVCVDGGMTPATLQHAKYADYIVSGSYLQKNGEKEYEEMSKQYASVQIPRT